MGLAQVLALILGLEPLLERGIVAVQVAASGAGGGDYTVLVSKRKATIAADKAQVSSDKGLDLAAIASVEGT